MDPGGCWRDLPPANIGRPGHAKLQATDARPAPCNMLATLKIMKDKAGASQLPTAKGTKLTRIHMLI